MLKLIYALQPALDYLIRIQVYKLLHKEIPREKRDDYIHSWSDTTLKRMNVQLKVKGSPSKKPCLFVGNHISYVDIPLVTSQVPAIFLAKKEVGQWPVIGNAGRALGTVYVDRSSESSRKKSSLLVAEKILKNKERVVVFPSGTTSVDENVGWRLGAFRLAAENKIPVQAFKIRYSPASIAFIGDDLFLPHLYGLLKLKKIEATIEFQRPKMIKNPETAMKNIKEWCIS